MAPYSRSASLPATRHSSRQAADNAAKEPSIFCGHLWKKSPGVNLLTQGYRWRYVVLLKGKMGWWASEKYALQEDAKGFVDFAVDACDVFPDDRSSATRFCVKPRTRRWSSGQVFTGANEGRTFVFDAEGSEHGRKSWLAAVNAHIEYGVRKRRQSVARLSLVKLSHSGVSAGELAEAIREGRAAGVESSALEHATVVLSRVTAQQKQIVDGLLKNPRTDDLFDDSGKPQSAQASNHAARSALADRASGKPELTEADEKAQAESSKPAVSTPASHPLQREELLTSTKETGKSRPSARGNEDFKPGSSSAPLFNAGQRVRISGLKTVQELNGKEGLLVEWDYGERRWKVRVENGTGFLIRPGNLEEVASGDCPGSSAGVPTRSKDQESAKEALKEKGAEDIDDQPQEATSETVIDGNSGEGLPAVTPPAIESAGESAADPSGAPEQQLAEQDSALLENMQSVEVQSEVSVSPEVVSLPSSPVNTRSPVTTPSPVNTTSPMEASQLEYEVVQDGGTHVERLQNQVLQEAPSESRRYATKCGDDVPMRLSGIPRDLAALYLENQRMGLTNTLSPFNSMGSDCSTSYSGSGSPSRRYGNFNPAERVTSAHKAHESPSRGDETSADHLKRDDEFEDSEDEQEGSSFWKGRMQQRSLPPPRRRHTETGPEEGSPLWLELRAKVAKRRATMVV